MAKKLIFLILCLCCVGWLILIFHLSTENGEKTADTSMRIAEKISGMIYSDPTQEQVAGVHHMVRKAAHVFLFFILGALTAATGLYILKFRGEPMTAMVLLMIGLGIIAGAGWLDEWHKQFIEGRHYQLDEAVINIVSGLVGGGLTIVVRNFFTGL